MPTSNRLDAPPIGFKRHMRAEVVANDAVYVFTERGVTALQGECIELIAPLLDGTRDLESLLRDTSDAGVSRQQVVRVVRRLEEKGLVGSWHMPEPMDETSCAYWDSVGLDPLAVTARLATPIKLITIGAIDKRKARQAFDDAGLNVNDGDDDGDEARFSVVLCDDYLSRGLGEVDEDHRRAKRPWLLARPWGERVWIGPVFVAEAQTGPCWHCLAERLRGHRPAETHVQAVLGRDRSVPRPAAAVPSLATAALHLTALEAMKWLAGHRHDGQRCVWTFDSVDLQGRRHEVRARPQCLSCGDPTLMKRLAQRPVVLGPQPKSGRHRIMPEETLARYRHLVSPISGVVKEICRARGTPAMLNVFRSGPISLPGARGVRGLRAALAMQNAGKGITPAQAETGALCEALERHSATFHGDEATLEGSYRSLGAQAIHPDACQLYHPRQFDGRERWNALHDTFQFVCAPFDDNAPMSWSPVWSLTHQHRRLLPTGMLYFGAPRRPGDIMVRPDSNGNAAGESLEDAVLRGLLELVERDSVAIWWYNRTRQPAVDLSAFADPWIDEMRDAYARMGREIWALDLTADLGVPVIAAVSRCVDQPREEIVFGFGADRDPRVALRRGLTELNQLCSSTGGTCSTGIDAEAWLKSATIENQQYLVPDPAQAPRKPDDYHYRPCGDLRDDVEILHDGLRRAGLELLVVDQTRPDIGLPAVKVIVPGLRHFWARFAPGRLYDIPVKLGRRPRPMSFDELNPVPLFV